MRSSPYRTALVILAPLGALALLAACQGQITEATGVRPGTDTPVPEPAPPVDVPIAPPPVVVPVAPPSLPTAAPAVPPAIPPVCTAGATAACYTGPAGTLGVGACLGGTSTCLDDGSGWGPCAGEVVPVSEDCATPEDEDCDGTNACPIVGKRGLTWTQYAPDACGQAHVSCNDCNPYVGDTACAESRPILCLRFDGAINCGEAPDFYNGWTGATVALTPPVPGTLLTSPAAADAICAAQYGPGFRMAEHHDGGGCWGFRGKGILPLIPTPPSTSPANGVPNLPNRFWVRISDQPGNCWDG
jgi:hypothetical protein